MLKTALIWEKDINLQKYTFTYYMSQRYENIKMLKVFKKTDETYKHTYAREFI